MPACRRDTPGTRARQSLSFEACRDRLRDEFLACPRVTTYLRRHTVIVDNQVLACARAARLPAQCALVAVGGYGRREMFPYSDIDVLILLPDSHDEEVDAAAAAFVTALWDLGLTVGSSVRTGPEMLAEAARDITIATAFLEARFLSGEQTLFESTYARFTQALDPKAFFSEKLLEMRQRHQRYADTAYALEPNIKESPGGLRDLQVFVWCARTAGLGKNWRELAAGGLITQTEAYHLNECLHTLHELRIRLHLLAGRHEDRLIFDIQTALARSAGLTPTGGLLPSEELMKRYYLNAKNTVQLNAIMLQAISDRLFSPNHADAPAKQLEPGFIARGETLDIVHDNVLRDDPRNVLRVFYLYACHRELKNFSTRLLRALWHSRYRINASFRNDPLNKALFLTILKLHYGPYHCLKNMNTWGILGRFLPAFRRIVGQMQHDLFHAYTVDQHTMRVVKFLRRFSHSSYAHEYPLCSQVISELPDAWRLTVAGLFHDIAKGRGGDHSLLGAREVRSFGESFGMDREAVDFVEFLVAHHLSMSTVAQKEDISDPDVIARFARTVQTKERLDGLFLLTVADIRATSPKVWNAWKQQLIEDLYQSTLEQVQGRHVTQNRASVFAERRDAACALVDSLGIPAFVRDAFWKELNIVYFLRHTPQDIAWHTKELAWSPSLPYAIVRCKLADGGAGIEVLVYVRDQKDLFARVVSCFEREGLSVLDARIHTTYHGWALDTFLVDDRRERGDLDFFISQFQGILTQALSEPTPLPLPRKGKLSRRSRSFPTPPFVNIERDETNKGWVLQVTGNDRLGLLYAIALVLARHGVNLETAKISTLGERIEDVFLIDSDSLNSEEEVLVLEKELQAVLADVS